MERATADEVARAAYTPVPQPELARGISRLAVASSSDKHTEREDLLTRKRIQPQRSTTYRKYLTSASLAGGSFPCHFTECPAPAISAHAAAHAAG